MDLYKTLGVTRGATPDDIKKAYRKLAKEYHPDLHPGDAKVERKFKDISAAYTILGDADKRKDYDRGALDANGNPTGFGGASGGFRGNPRPGAGRANPGGGRFQADEAIFDSDFFNDIFSAAGAKRPGGRPNAARGTAREAEPSLDIQHTLTVTFIEAALGVKKRVSLSQERAVEVNVPAGVEDGQVLRLKGQGRLSNSFGAPGDALIKISIARSGAYNRDGLNVTSDVPITLAEALDGASVPVDTIHARVSLKIPAGANTDMVLRLKGQGIQAADANKGDHLVRLKVMLPEAANKELADFVRSWTAKNPYTVRFDAK
ncbi:MAG: J domain-containing protein [Alphaproteobacteria bacterium]|nr:J domain-containing protein [Alphaproteobacteria bacterium]